jgi:hypothetical protein
MAIFDPSTWFGPPSPYGSPLPGIGNPYNPAAAFQYDPAIIRRSAISNALLSAGAAMLGQGPSRTPINFGTSLGQGLSAGLQGADTGMQQAMQRQQFAQQAATGAQQYQAGKIALAGNYGDLAFQAYRLSRILGRQVTPQELLAHPELAQNSFAAQPNAGAPSAPSALDPTAQGGQPESTWQPQQGQDDSGGGAPLAPQTAPAAGGLDTQLAAYDQAINDDLVFNGGKGVAALEKARADLIGAPRQAADVAAATDLAKAGGPLTHWDNLKTITSQYNDDPNIERQQQVAQVAPTFFAAAAAGADPKTGQQIAYAGSPYTDQQLIGMAAKIFNPAMRLRGGNIVTEEDIPNIAGEIQHLIPGYVAGKSHLDPAAREAVIALVKKQLQTTDQLYSTSFGKLANRAKDMGVSQDEFGGTPRFAMTKQEYDALPSGALYYDPNGQLGRKP